MDKIALLCLLIISAAMAALSAQAASFDCAKAAIPIEHLICADKALSKLDEQYAELYKLARKKTADNPETHALVKSLAIKSLKIRNRQCTDSRCTEKWYFAGKDRLSQRLMEADPAWFQKKLTGKLLYERLNVRSFKNMLGPRLKSVNSNYLKDFYPKSSTRIYPRRLEIEHEGERWNIVVTGKHTIEVENSIVGASYSTDNIEYIYFDPISDELRVGMPSHCNFISQGSSPDFSARESLQHRSLGEIGFNLTMARSTVEIFNAPNGKPVGKLHFSIEDISKKNSPGPINVHKMRFCDTAFNTYIEPSFQIRMKYDVSVLYFGDQDSWLNLSADPATPAWVHRAKLPITMSTNIKSREQVMQEGSNIIVKSNHRLRNKPTTDSDVLHVLQTDDQGSDAIIEPIKVVGDWMRVSYSSPNPYLVRYDENDPNATKPTVIKGWLKWRKSPGSEYVNIHYQTLGH